MLSAIRLFLLMQLSITAGGALAFDHEHTQWTALLADHVELMDEGRASRVRYADLKRGQGRLDAYLRTLSAVSRAEFSEWPKPRQLAFLINVYNAFTIKLVLQHYPGLASIRDLGTELHSPWEIRFIELLGRQQSLDEIEHGMIRTRGTFDEPLIHFALVCASVSCPMLRNEAYTWTRLDAQLNEAFCTFLSNRRRNYFDPAAGVLHVSSLFLWYREDFESGHRGFTSLPEVFTRHAHCLSVAPSGQNLPRAGQFRIAFLPYDWSLNDATVPARSH